MSMIKSHTLSTSLFSLANNFKITSKEKLELSSPLNDSVVKYNAASDLEQKKQTLQNLLGFAQRLEYPIVEFSHSQYCEGASRSFDSENIATSLKVCDTVVSFKKVNNLDIMFFPNYCDYSQVSNGIEKILKFHLLSNAPQENEIQYRIYSGQHQYEINADQFIARDNLKSSRLSCSQLSLGFFKSDTGFYLNSIDETDWNLVTSINQLKLRPHKHIAIKITEKTHFFHNAEILFKTHLTHCDFLDLSGLDITDKELESLLIKLEELPNLKELDLSYNQITNNGLVYLLHYLKFNFKNALRVNLSSNFIVFDNLFFEEKIKDYLLGNLFLTRLELSYNQISSTLFPSEEKDKFLYIKKLISRKDAKINNRNAIFNSPRATFTDGTGCAYSCLCEAKKLLQAAFAILIYVEDNGEIKLKFIFEVIDKNSQRFLYALSLNIQRNRYNAQYFDYEINNLSIIDFIQLKLTLSKKGNKYYRSTTCSNEKIEKILDAFCGLCQCSCFFGKSIGDDHNPFSLFLAASVTYIEDTDIETFFIRLPNLISNECSDKLDWNKLPEKTEHTAEFGEFDIVQPLHSS